MYFKLRLNLGAEIFEAKGAIVVAPQSRSGRMVCIKGSDCRPALAPQRASAGRENGRRASHGNAKVDFSTVDARPPYAPSCGDHEATAAVTPGGAANIPVWHQESILPAAMPGGATLGCDLDVMLAELERVFTALRRLESRLAGLVSSKPSSIH
jgi:hypothetical protein